MSTINSRFNVKIELFRASIRRVYRSPENDPRHAMTFQLYRIHAHTLLHLYISTPYIHTTYSHIDRRTILSLRDRSRYEVARSQSLISLLFSLSISPSPLSVSRLSVSLYIRIYHSFSFSLSFSRYILSLSLLLCLSTSRSVSLRRSGLLRTAPCYLVDSFAFTARNLCEVFERSIILILSFPLSLSHRINLILPRCERSVFQLPISIFLRSRAAATFFLFRALVVVAIESNSSASVSKRASHARPACSDLVSREKRNRRLLIFKEMQMALGSIIESFALQTALSFICDQNLTDRFTLHGVKLNLRGEFCRLYLLENLQTFMTFAFS